MSQTPTEAQLEKWLGWMSLPATRIPDQDVLAAHLQQQLDAIRAPVVLAPLQGGGWCVDGRYYHGRCPAGLVLVWQAVRAFQSGVAAPLVEASRCHAVGKSIKTDAMNWAGSRRRRLMPVIECISVERISAEHGRVVYGPTPGVPEVITIVSAS